MRYSIDAVSERYGVEHLSFKEKSEGIAPRDSISASIALGFPVYGRNEEIETCHN